MNKEKDIVYLISILFGIKRYVKSGALCGVDISSLYDEYSKQLASPEIELLISEADRLSLGVENVDMSGSEDCNLVSILDTIKRPGDYQSLFFEKSISLQLNDSIFPTRERNSQSDIDNLWNQFNDELKMIKTNDVRSFAETLLSLLYKYASRVSISVAGQNDISLYDHIRVMSAIAVCLYVNAESSKNDNDAFRLVGADFSGIQPYIYQIVSKHAAKNLKGRSFYLRLLSDAVVRFLLNELELYSANIVYNSGGGFYLLVPNTESVVKKLEHAIDKIENNILKEHVLSLYVAIDSAVVSKSDLLHKTEHSLGDIWGDVFLKRDKKKFSRFAKQIANLGKEFFNPFMTGGDVAQDSITGEEFFKGEEIIKKDSLTLKKNTFLQIEIGKKLKSTVALLVVTGNEISSLKDVLHIQPCGLGITYYFVSEISELKPAFSELKNRGNDASLVTINGEKSDCDFLSSARLMPENIHKLEFYGGVDYKMKVWNTFESMCDTSSEFSRLGVLRMDVDNLGSVFQSGIEKSKASLARFASLSRSFDLFFSGYLNTLWKELYPDNSSIIYSGGDDVFVVGSWNATIEIAKAIHENFSKYACYNPAFSLSGGIAILQPKYPIMKGAEESATEEDAAKSHMCGTREKNSISFMDMPMNWDNEFPAAEKLKNTLVSLMLRNELPKSFVQKLLSHFSNANINAHVIRNVKTYWMLTYDLSRMKERYKNVSKLIDTCILEICSNKKNTLNGESLSTDYHPLELWAFAARWAELEYRMTNNN